ncbi:GYF domain-containing protein [Roseibacillus persicicus]|uniref:GYF domain-containing protein n=1 Tax=Roseibacillus persicicus TaxID=454148 RepID=UPI00398A68C3
MWYFESNGTQQGPEDSGQIQKRLSNGELSGSTLVWREGMGDWTPLSQVPELNSHTVAPVQAVAGPYAPPQHIQGVLGAAGSMPTSNGMAITSMILAICSVVLTFGCGIGFVLALPAVIFGHIARNQIKSSSNMQTGEGMALAGLIIGYIVLAVMLVMLVAVGVAIGLDS